MVTCNEKPPQGCVIYGVVCCRFSVEVPRQSEMFWPERAKRATVPLSQRAPVREREVALGIGGCRQAYDAHSSPFLPE